MGEKATRYIQSLKRINAEKAKKERDEFLISHNFKTTIKDENGREKTIAETVTDEEYEILREAFFVDPDPKAKEDKASAGWFPILIGGLTVIVGVALFFYCISNVSTAIAWGVLISCVVLASVLFALGEIVNGIRQIELTSNINEKTLKEILKYIKDSNKSSNASKESDPKENSTDDLVSEDKTEPKEEKNTNIGQECQSAEKEVSVPQQKPIVVQPTKKKDAPDQAVVIVIFVTAVIVALIIGWYLLFGIK